MREQPFFRSFYTGQLGTLPSATPRALGRAASTGLLVAWIFLVILSATAALATGRPAGRMDLAGTLAIVHGVSLATLVSSVFVLVFAVSLWQVLQMYDQRLEAAAREDMERLIQAARLDREAIRRQEDRFGSLIQNASDVILIAAEDGVLRWVSPSAQSMLGQATERLVGSSLLQLVSSDDLPAACSLLGEVHGSSGTNVTSELQLRGANGDERIVEAVAVNLLADERIEGIVVTCRDITERKHSEIALRQSEGRYRAIVETAQEGIWTIDAEAVTTFVNQRMAALLGYTVAEMIGEPLWSFMDTADRAITAANLKLRSEGIAAQHDFKFLHKDGSPVWTIVQTNGLHDEAGRHTGALAMVTDISERVRAETALRQSEERYRGIVETAQEGVWTLGPDAKTTFANRRLTRILGYTVDEMLGRSLFDFMDEADQALVAESLQRGRQGIPEPLDFRFRRKDGSSARTIVHANYLHDDAGRYAGALAMVTDISGRVRDDGERERLQRELFQQAFYDALTGLPNRALFLTRLAQAMTPVTRRKPAVGVLFLDLDNFKLVNDTLGHDAGDELLKIVAARLTSCVRPEDTVARLGGDEFTILLDGIGKQKCIGVAERILRTLTMPAVIQGQEVFPSASIGVALRTSHTDTADHVLRNADLAMYKAKAAGRDCYAVFDPSMNAEILGRLQMEAELRHAIDHDEFRIYYQPLVSMSTGQIEELEALVRWAHPLRGLLLPEEFIAVAEETGLIVPIGAWVLREACRQAGSWERHRSVGEPLVLNVNVSARQFRDLALVETVAGVLQETGLPPELLKLEITESAVMDDPSNTVHGARPERAEGDGSPVGDRRLRHRLLLAGLSQAVSVGHAESRPLLRRGPAARRAVGRADRRRGGAREEPASHRHGRRRRDTGAACQPA